MWIIPLGSNSDIDTSKIPENSLFSERHGRLLSLVNSNIEEDMVKVLFQFFDPLHHCFTFPDYQLVPTLEEFSQDRKSVV